MNSKLAPTIIIVSTIVVIATAVYFAGKSDPISYGKNQTSRQTTDNSEGKVPKLWVENRNFRLAPNIIITQKDISIKNNGSGPLTINKIKTSCSCVSVTFFQPGNDGPAISGSKGSNWQMTLESTGEGLIRINFDKNSYDWNNPADETVSFETNDPDNPTVIVHFTTKEIPVENTTVDNSVNNTTNTDAFDQYWNSISGPSAN